MSNISTERRPSEDQVKRIKELSAIVLNDPGRLFREIGYPDNAWEASQYIVALNHVRNGELNGDLAQKISEIRKKPEQVDHRTEFGEETAKEAKRRKKEAAVAAQTEKTCRKCGTTKPADEEHFGSDSRTHDGLGKTCSECKSEQASKARAKRKTTKTTSDKGSEGETATPPVAEAPTASSPPSPSEQSPLNFATGRGLDELREIFRDPRLSHLRLIQQILMDELELQPDGIDLESAGEVAQALAAADWA